jgi:methylated-DNA-[protein]-cysteine S-methyltransferase
MNRGEIGKPASNDDLRGTPARPLHSRRRPAGQERGEVARGGRREVLSLFLLPSVLYALRRRWTVLRSVVFETDLGFFALSFSDRGLVRTVLPEPDAATARRRLVGRGVDPTTVASDGTRLPDAVEAIMGAVRRYAKGETVDFRFAAIDYGRAPAFDRDVWEAARNLAHGEIVTYGELAARAGHPGLARETGAALGRNPVPLVVPCHRIAAANGRTGGFSAPGGVNTKLRLLDHEGARRSPEVPAQAAFGF